MRKAILTMTIFAVVLTSCMAASEEKMERIIYVKGNNGTVVFELNSSKAADDLWKQLPLETEVGNFSNNEKIFYPEKDWTHQMHLLLKAVKVLWHTTGHGEMLSCFTAVSLQTLHFMVLEELLEDRS